MVFGEALIKVKKHILPRRNMQNINPQVAIALLKNKVRYCIGYCIGYCVD